MIYLGKEQVGLCGTVFSGLFGYSGIMRVKRSGSIGSANGTNSVLIFKDRLGRNMRAISKKSQRRVSSKAVQLDNTGLLPYNKAINPSWGKSYEF